MNTDGTTDLGEYLVWSHEHSAWWAPDERGYVADWRKAGRYRREVALRIVANATHAFIRHKAPNEVPVRLADLVEAFL